LPLLAWTHTTHLRRWNTLAGVSMSCCSIVQPMSCAESAEQSCRAVQRCAEVQRGRGVQRCVELFVSCQAMQRPCRASAEPCCTKLALFKRRAVYNHRTAQSRALRCRPVQSQQCWRSKAAQSCAELCRQQSTQSSADCADSTQSRAESAAVALSYATYRASNANPCVAAVLC
jgi:hypothetical protein